MLFLWNVSYLIALFHSINKFFFKPKKLSFYFFSPLPPELCFPCVPSRTIGSTDLCGRRSWAFELWRRRWSTVQSKVVFVATYLRCIRVLVATPAPRVARLHDASCTCEYVNHSSRFSVYEPWGFVTKLVLIVEGRVVIRSLKHFGWWQHCSWSCRLDMKRRFRSLNWIQNKIWGRNKRRKWIKR